MANMNDVATGALTISVFFGIGSGMIASHFTSDTAFSIGVGIVFSILLYLILGLYVDNEKKKQ